MPILCLFGVKGKILWFTKAIPAGEPTVKQRVAFLPATRLFLCFTQKLNNLRLEALPFPIAVINLEQFLIKLLN